MTLCLLAMRWPCCAVHVLAMGCPGLRLDWPWAVRVLAMGSTCAGHGLDLKYAGHGLGCTRASHMLVWMLACHILDSILAGRWLVWTWAGRGPDWPLCEYGMDCRCVGHELG
jgi:hypothetical protein